MGNHDGDNDYLIDRGKPATNGIVARRAAVALSHCDS